MIISERPFDPRSIPVIGCNLSFRRSVLDEAGAYDERFGPGSTIGSGDDVDMLYRIQRAGHKLVYAPQVVVYHDHGRRVGEDEGPTIYRYLRGRGGFYTKYIALRDRHITKCAYRELRQASLTMLRGMFHGCIDRPTLALLRALASGAVAYMRAPSKQQIQPAMIRILPAPAAAADSTAQPSTAFTK
jgi:GT2 family glycosyltransferase